MPAPTRDVLGNTALSRDHAVVSDAEVDAAIHAATADAYHAALILCRSFLVPVARGSHVVCPTCGQTVPVRRGMLPPHFAASGADTSPCTIARLAAL